MNIGCFSMSLAVKDLVASRAFYEKLGFSVYAGELAHNFLIMKNGETNIGLFQSMFEHNIMTFNPGWDQHAQALPRFTDVRQIAEQLTAQGIELSQHQLKNERGPGSFAVTDPDGNTILFDQHV